MTVKDNPISMKESVKDLWVSMKGPQIPVKKPFTGDGRDRMPGTHIPPIGPVGVCGNMAGVRSLEANEQEAREIDRLRARVAEMHRLTVLVKYESHERPPARGCGKERGTRITFTILEAAAVPTSTGDAPNPRGLPHGLTIA